MVINLVASYCADHYGTFAHRNTNANIVNRGLWICRPSRSSLIRSSLSLRAPRDVRLAALAFMGPLASRRDLRRQSASLALDFLNPCDYVAHDRLEREDGSRNVLAGCGQQAHAHGHHQPETECKP